MPINDRRNAGYSICVLGYYDVAAMQISMREDSGDVIK
jgi:hypothetical protein